MKILIYTLALAISQTLYSYESMHEKTPVGEIVIIDLPERIALEASTSMTYFSENNGLFRKLFKYIGKNDISMTTPVEAEIEPGKMRFFVGEQDLKKSFGDSEDVKVRKLVPRKVASIGIRGGYSEERYLKNLKRLNDWVDANESLEIIGLPYGVYWNGPFVPGPFKRSEIHIPIRVFQKKKTQTNNTEEPKSP